MVGLFILSIGCAEGMKGEKSVEEIRGELYETCSTSYRKDGFDIKALKKLINENKNFMFEAINSGEIIDYEATGSGYSTRWAETKGVDSYVHSVRKRRRVGPIIQVICAKEANFEYNVDQVLSTLLREIGKIRGGKDELEFYLVHNDADYGQTPILRAFKAAYEDKEYARGALNAIKAILRDGGDAGKKSLVTNNISRSIGDAPFRNAFRILGKKQPLSALDIVIMGLMLGGYYDRFAGSYSLDGIGEKLLKLLLKYAKKETIASINKIRSKVDEIESFSSFDLWIEDIAKGGERRKKFDKIVEKVLGKI